MNQKAKNVGAVSSNFSNPDGCDADGQYTTAFDLAQIAKAGLDKIDPTLHLPKAIEDPPPLVPGELGQGYNY